MTADSPRIVLLFVDGLGLGPDDPGRNPIVRGPSPRLARLLRRHAVPLDATLGVPGLPQSATGQTALLTGDNAAALMGRHVEGFPPAALRELIRERNLLGRLERAGIPSTFANAYAVREGRSENIGGRWSVTTVAALSAYGQVRTLDDLAAGRAVYQDVTRASLVDRGFPVRRVEPAEAARHLLDIAEERRLTLFEYFQTDRAGHTGDGDIASRVLETLDAFLSEVWEGCLRRRMLMVLTSDHGNIEDLSVPTHTTNPVPLAAVGEGSGAMLDGARSLTDVAPRLLAAAGLTL